MIKNHTTFFKPWDTIHESNPQEILERHEPVTLVPLLIMQGALDDNVLPGGAGEVRRDLQGRRRRRASSRCSRAASTSGSPSRGRRPTAPARWSRRSSRASCSTARG